tara:strand:- start:137 stop:1279 length:1143 start_codon:yes stop_codon:yes gene_type:complete
MKLNVDLSLLEQAVRTMGAEQIQFDITSDIVPMEPLDIKLNQGFEVNFEDIDFDTGLASYEGRQVLLYIKDHSYGNKIHKVLEDGSVGNKYHVADCSKLEEMRRKGRFERYVVTNKLDGLFSVSGTDTFTNEHIEGETRLAVCQLCLKGINYIKFTSLKTRDDRLRFAKNFNLADFFETYSSFFKYMPTGVAGNSNNQYSEDWDEISRRIREKYHYQCQQCGLDLNTHKRLLHVHHINGIKSDNSSSNLTPLCCDCHRKQPDHQHINVRHEDTKLIAQLRKEQRLNTRESWKDIYDLADPGMHGVIDLLEKYHVSLPEVGEEIQNENNEVIAELELAWPLRKIGVAVSKDDAKAAYKLGWKVYSMRLAIRDIEQLVSSLR